MSGEREAKTEPCWFCDGTGCWPPVPLGEPVGYSSECPECHGHGYLMAPEPTKGGTTT